MKITDLPERYQKQAEQKLNTQHAPPKQNKYRNEKVTDGALKFDSKKEQERYQELKLMQEYGEIRGLKLQHEFTLQGAFTDTNGERTRAIKYIADFTYWRGNDFIIEDTKGFRTKEYKLKKKMMAAHGWRITEV